MESTKRTVKRKKLVKSTLIPELMEVLRGRLLPGEDAEHLAITMAKVYKSYEILQLQHCTGHEFNKMIERLESIRDNGPIWKKYNQVYGNRSTMLGHGYHNYADPRWE